MKIPEYIKEIINKLTEAGFEAYIVGGCVRDLLLASYAPSGAEATGKKASDAKAQGPKDWDITTNARPEQILKVFPKGKYENVFGTVLIPVKNGASNEVVEITTYRSEQGYSDRRHPDEIKFEDSLDKDLERRDFTINAMAIALIPPTPLLKGGEGGLKFPFNKGGMGGFVLLNKDEKVKIIDLFGGQKDIKKKIIRAVGEPVDRFKEDGLRMIRAIRFACQLGFAIEPKTQRGITKMAGGIKFIAKERIKDELIKILKSDHAYEGILLLQETKLLQYILPDLIRGVGVEQNRHHVYTVFKHSVLSLKFTPSSDWRVKFASLMHDIAKPQTKKLINGVETFYNHEMVGARLTKKIMKRLKFSAKDIEKVVNLIRSHMFYYNVGEVTASSVRRLIAKTGEANLKDLIDLRVADRLGSGVPKAKPYKLRHLEYMMEKVRHDPTSVKMLEINGDKIMELLKISPGPKIGAILDVLLSEVIEDPNLNNAKHLSERSKELSKMELADLRHKAKEVIEEKRTEEDKELKKEFWVK